jgi:hypothetical protein
LIGKTNSTFGGGNSTKLSNMPLGMLLRVTENGVNVNYELAGFDAYGENTAMFVRKDIYGTSTRTQHYADSAIDTLCNSTIYGKFTSALKAKILEVTLTLATSSSTSTTIDRKCFLPTMTNMGFGNNNGTAEGVALSIYDTNASRIKKLSGSNTAWWLSSWESSSSAKNVLQTGALSYSSFGSKLGVVPAFVLSSDEQVQFPPISNNLYDLA